MRTLHKLPLVLMLLLSTPAVAEDVNVQQILDSAVDWEYGVDSRTSRFLSSDGNWYMIRWNCGIDTCPGMAFQEVKKKEGKLYRITSELIGIVE